jgi:hypothetical protein
MESNPVCKALATWPGGIGTGILGLKFKPFGVGIILLQVACWIENP